MPSSRLSIRPPTRRSKSRQKRDNIESSLLGMDQPKKLAGLSSRTWLSATVLLVALVIVSPLVYAARPYFKAFGADVFTGGWFNSGVDACTTSANYQDPTPDETGGILAFSKIGPSPGIPAGGSSSQFAALSVGSVQGGFSSQLGFYSSGVSGNAHPASWLTLANNTGNLGGKMEVGPPVQGNCIPDYYETKKASATVFSGTTSPDVSTAPAGSYINPASTGSVESNSAGGTDTILPGKELTIIVNGNVYIHNNISYSPSSTASTVPKFTLIARGSIYIDQFVTQLDGLYIAQPDPTKATQVGSSGADHGIIWTCHPNSTSPYTMTQMASNCRSKLTVNGALIAKQINLLRIFGDITSAPANETASCPTNPIAQGTPCAIEVINYTPAMVLGGPFFNQSTSPKIQSLISLPPVF